MPCGWRGRACRTPAPRIRSWPPCTRARAVRRECPRSASSTGSSSGQGTPGSRISSSSSPRQPPLERMWVNAKCINTTARRARLPACVTELARLDQATVRAEARLRVGDPVERRFGVVAVPVGPYDRVERVALRGDPPRVADEAPELGRPDELPVLRAGGGRDRLVDQPSTEVVGAGMEHDP